MKKILVISSLLAGAFATPSFATPTELDKKTVASKAYVDTKQDKIATGLVEFTDGTMLPAITTYDTTSGLVGNKIGILDLVTIEDDEGALYNYSTFNGYGTEMDNFVPTVHAVANALRGVQWEYFTWDNNTLPAAIGAYSTTFDPTEQHVTGNWPFGQQGYLVPATTFANSLALKQNKIPAGTAGNVMTYTGNAGTVGSVAVSSTEDYNQQNELTNGSNLANVQLVSTKQNKMVCAGWDSETHTDEHCWLWSIE